VLRLSILVLRAVISCCVLPVSVLAVTTEVGLPIFDDMEDTEISSVQSNRKLIIVNTDAFGRSLCFLFVVSISLLL